MNDNPDAKVISLKTRKPLAEEQAEQKARQEQNDQEFLQAQLDILDKVREQVAAGRLQNLVIVSRNPQTGMFMQDMIFEPNFHTSGLAFAFAGLLEALKLEVSDIAQLTPTLQADGTLIDPHFADEMELADGEFE